MAAPYNGAWGEDMNVIVHLCFAQAVRRAVKRQCGVRLSLFGFLFGNILPDLSAAYRRHPHFLAQSQEFVFARVGLLVQEPGTRGSFAQGRQLGVVTHYLSDYCCWAHTEAFGGDMRAHHLYELRMLRGLRAGCARFAREAQSRPESPARLRRLMERHLAAQRDETPCGARDTYYALRLSAAAVLLLAGAHADADAESARAAVRFAAPGAAALRERAT